MPLPEHTPWIIKPKPVEEALVRLFCIPYAGGDASVFRMWPAYLPPEIEVNAIEFPGCLRRIAEPPYTSIAPLVNDLARFLLPHLDRPFAIFGLCTGSFIAFELTRQIRNLCGREPLHFFPTCIWAPHLPYGYKHIHALPEKEFIKEFGLLGGMAQEAMDEPDLMKILVVAARADFQAAETYECVEGVPLTCPLTAIGANLDHLVKPEQVTAWNGYTQGSFKSKILDGDHFLWETSREPLVHAVHEGIQSSLASEREESFL